MNNRVLLGWGLAIGMGLVVTCAVAYGERMARRKPINREPDGWRYTGGLGASMSLPLLMCTFPVLGILTGGSRGLTEILFDLFFGVFVQMCIYYPILFLLLPLLRKKISPRVCAGLWVLPSVLYVTARYISHRGAIKPRVVIPVKWAWLEVASVVWLAGFVLVLGWKVLEHLRFRKKVLENAYEVTDPAILALWEEEQREGGMTGMSKAALPLMISPDVKTPLSVGVFLKHTVVLLPQRYYAPEDLRLIFRHELVHIQRNDGGGKFFLAFCTAMCWFNPLVWLAMRASAQDMELGCDEMVLLDADQTTRRRYADLILATAGDGRGFTTCLSASAQTMRYRLKNIMAPTKRALGGVLAGVVTTVLVGTCGFAAFSVEQTTGREAIFQGTDPTAFTIEDAVSIDNDLNFTYFECPDPEGLLTYLAQLPLDRVTGDYRFKAQVHGANLTLFSPEGREYYVSLRDDGVLVRTYLGEVGEKDYHRNASDVLYFAGSIDWDYLDTLIVVPNQTPKLIMDHNPEGSDFFKDIEIPGTIVNQWLNGTPELVTTQPAPAQRLGGAWNQDVKISFSLEPVDKEFHVLIENWDRTQVRTIHSSELEQRSTLKGEWVLPMEGTQSEHYTIRAKLEDGPRVYEMEFKLDVDRS